MKENDKLNNHIEKYLKLMYNISDISAVPEDVKEALFFAQTLAERAGGELVSRQTIASIIVSIDKDIRYSI